MSPFDYLSVLLAIVTALAIANVFSRLATVVTARQRVDFYWPPVAWGIWIFVVCVQHWWAIWGERRFLAWNFGSFLLELLIPVDFYFLSALILPEREEDGKLDLGVWYARNRVWFFAVLFFAPLLSLLSELARSGKIASPANLAFLLLFEVAAVAGIALRSRRAQEWLTGQAMVLTAVYVALLFFWMPR